MAVKNNSTNLLTEDAPATAALSSVNLRTRAKGKESILIVEDDPDTLRLLEYLMASEGYTVLTSECSEDAMALLDTFTPDAMLMDIRLPGIDGLQLTRMLKLNGHTKKVPILAVSARNTALAIQEAYDAGCDGYLTKPVDPRTFASTVCQYLDRDSRYLHRRRQPSEPAWIEAEVPKASNN